MRFREQQVAGPLPRLRRVEQLRRGAAGGDAAAQGRAPSLLSEAGGRPTPYDLVDAADTPRISSGIGEFDRVLGGGIVPGSMVLIGGEPGIGKTTLLTQVAHLLGRQGGPVLYVSGEESERQIKMRGERLGISGAGLFLMAETSLERILEQVDHLQPAALVIDSVQTVFSARFPSAPGSISQVREVATQLLMLAKGRGVTTFLIGHVTKDGSLAGPKSLEHIVDTVLYFEGEKQQHHRIVRAVKNRFGAVSEMGVFEMTGTGLQPVPNPSALFLSERLAGSPGSAVVATLEGSRPMLVEIQALVSPTSFGNPRRMTIVLDVQSDDAADGRAREARGLQCWVRRVRERAGRGSKSPSPPPTWEWPPPSLPFRNKPSVPARHPCLRRGGLGGEVAAPGRPPARARSRAMGFTRCIAARAERAAGSRGHPARGGSTLEEPREAWRRSEAGDGCPGGRDLYIWRLNVRIIQSRRRFIGGPRDSSTAAPGDGGARESSYVARPRSSPGARPPCSFRLRLRAVP